MDQGTYAFSQKKECSVFITVSHVRPLLNSELSTPDTEVLPVMIWVCVRLKHSVSSDLYWSCCHCVNVLLSLGRLSCSDKILQGLTTEIPFYLETAKSGEGQGHTRRFAGLLVNDGWNARILSTVALLRGEQDKWNIPLQVSITFTETSSIMHLNCGHRHRCGTYKYPQIKVKFFHLP